MRQDIVDRGIEKAENGMKTVLQPIADHVRKEAEATDTNREGNTSDPTVPELDEEAIRNRKVNPEAVKESFKEAELDPLAETEPEEGETAA